MPREKKKMLILAILAILRDGTDADHRIRQAEIITRLQRDHHLSATRKSVRKNLGDLQEAGYPVVFRKGWYYEHGYTPAEMDYLLDCVSGSALPESQRTALLQKLTKLGGPFYEPGREIVSYKPANPQFLYTLDTLHRAVAEGRQVSFKYGNYDVDKQLHPRLNEEGKPKLYKVNPYRVSTANGRYYLICNVDKYDELCHFRVDRIMECKQLKSALKPISKLANADEAPLTEQYVDEHPYMYTGKPKKHRIEVRRDHINDVLDWFGMNVTFEKVTEESAVAVVVADPTSVELWLRRYREYAKPVEK